jgi:hypothetical protein
MIPDCPEIMGVMQLICLAYVGNKGFRANLGSWLMESLVITSDAECLLAHGSHIHCYLVHSSVL